MTVREIAGLVALNVFFLGVGIGVLLGVRGWGRWRAVARLAGVGYLLGVSTFMIVTTLELVVGIPFGLAAIVVTGLALGLGGAAIGWRRKVEPDTTRARSGGELTLVAAIFVGAILVYFEALFRAGRLSGLGWDVWASWVPKAKDLYYSGGLDATLLTAVPGSSYPPGLPILDATGFHAMGSADAVTLHLQYWFLGLGFAAAVAGLLAPRVRVVLLLPFLLLMLTMPDFRNRATDLYGDIPLGFLIASGALLLLLWLDDRSSWQLLGATLLLGGAVLTKREGILFAAGVILAALVATVHERRTLWPRLLASGAVAFACSLPWRVWFTANHLPSDGPEGGYSSLFGHLDRVGPSFHLVLSTIFDYNLWLVVPAVGLAATFLAYLAGARRDAVFVLVLVGTAVVGSAWTLWSNPSVELSTSGGLVNRVVGTPILTLAAMTPLLLEKAWSAPARSTEDRAAATPVWKRAVPAWAPWAVVVAAFLLYPSITLAGGRPSFPSHRDCVLSPASGQKVRVVFGYANTYPEAIVLRDHALAVGFKGTHAAADGCGRVRVSVDGVPSPDVGAAVIEEAKKVGLDPTLELDPGT